MLSDDLTGPRRLATTQAFSLPKQTAPSRPVRPRDELVAAWLLLLLDRGATYGYELRRELDAASVSIDSSVVYRTLRKLEADRLVSSRWARSRQGPRRRSYRITAQGRRKLDDAAEVIASIRAVHDMFLRGHAEAVSRRRSTAA